MVGISVVVAIAVAAGGAPPSPPEAMPVAPGALEVQAGGTPEAPQVEYDVKEPYPAAGVILFLVETLAKRGWKPVQLGNLIIAPEGEKGKPVAPPDVVAAALDALRARDWDAFHQASPTRRSWHGRWRDSTGREVSYTLVYTCPIQDGMQCVYVHVCGALYRVTNTAASDTSRSIAGCPTLIRPPSVK